MKALALFVLLFSFLVSGCASLSGRATRALTSEEVDYLSKLRQRVTQNKANINKSLADLAALYASKVEDEHSLSLSVSKAKLLESMQAPWAAPAPHMAETQRAVVLYHLYDLAEAQQALLDARLNERKASLRALMDAYGKLDVLIGQAVENERLILAYLNQPAAARISAVAGQLLVEVNAFRDQLARSDKPELQALAQKADRASERIDRTKDRIDQLLATLARSKEK